MGAPGKEEKQKPKPRKWPAIGASSKDGDAEEDGRDHGTKCVP